MARSLLIPCSVSAKVVTSPVQVSSLASQPFQKDAVLEVGVHVHWALPDALTSAAIDTPTETSQALFPGVPDLWLVVRFNASGANDTKRNWSAWVVDSQAGTATPLASWKPPVRDTTQVFTAAGMLPVTSQAGYTGWGALPNTATYDPAQAAYYPAARNRFGFYDNMPVGAGVEVSYTVIGWYSLAGYDPLASSSDPVGLLAGWNLDWPIEFIPLPTPVGAATVNVPAWLPPSLNIVTPVATREAAVGIATSIVREKSAATKTALAFDSAAANGITALDADLLIEIFAPSGIVCHGSVFSVGGSPSSVSGALPASAIGAHPSIKRAMAAVSNGNANEDQLDYAEMMLQNLDTQTGTTAGVLDLPGAAQSLSFQGVPGKPSYFAKMEIGPLELVHELNPVWALLTADEDNGTGNWPQIATRSAGLLSKQPAPVKDVIKRPGGVRGAMQAWINQLMQALATTVAQATVPVDPRFIHVNDTRSSDTGMGAQPVVLGKNPQGDGPDGAGWWLDTTDPHALQLLYESTETAAVSLPTPGDLHRVPGPRWYRPWSPHVVLTDAGRSFRFGCDGRYSSDGVLQCRVSGDEVSSLQVNGGPTVAGSTVLFNPAAFSALPPDFAPLLEEAALLDVMSARVIANVSKQAVMLISSAQTSIYVSRDPSKLTGAVATAYNFTVLKGVQPSPVALTPWVDPFDPLYMDAKYTYLDSPIAGNWELQDDYVELTAVQGAAPAGTSGSAQFSERTRVTATLANVLKSSMVTGRTLDPSGHLVPANTPPTFNNASATADQMDQLNVISAPLVKCDDLLVGASYRERAGALRVDAIDLVDVFGIAHSYPSPGDAVPSPVVTELTPRLPYWARLKFRLQAGADPTKEADRVNSPVCGFLVPDYIDHAMDVFDATGAALGQIVSDPPQTTAGGGTLTVSFVPLPWLPLAAGADPTTLITNPTLRSLVVALEAQTLAIPEQAGGGVVWYETGLTAMMRIIDTVRGTLDPLAKTQDKRVKLIGEPIVVFPARVTMEATLATDPGGLSGDPAPLIAPPAVPAVPFRIGDITRPDDGVLGLFDAVRGKFAPVSMDAANNAILSGLSQPLFYTGPPTLKVTHPFIEPQQNAITPGGAPVDVVVLADARGAYYATCGVVPRKKIVMPMEYIQPVIANIEPVIQAGPVVTIDGPTGVQPVLADPKIEGMTGVFIFDLKDPVTQADSYPALTLPRALPLADLPTDRIVLDSGWIRLDADA